ncbi:MAG: radical SAM protein [Myxococcota bacterium]
MTRFPSAFDHHAERYATLWADDPVAQRMRDVVRTRTLAHLSTPGRVLDAGCGIGLDIDWLRAAGHDVVGIDASEGMVAQARRRHPDLPIHPLPIEDAAALNGLFDAALLNFGVINCVDLPRAAAALAALLPHGAPLVVVPMPRLNPRWMLDRLQSGHPREAIRRMRKILEVDVDGQPVRTRYLSSSDVRRGLSPWFQPVEQQSLGLLLPPPRTNPDPISLARLEALEARVRGLPGLRRMGDHLLMVFRRTLPKPPPAGAGPIRRRLQTRHAKQTGQIRRLRALVLEVTQGCQSRCVSCDFRGPAGGEALTPQRCGALAEAAQQRGCEEIILTGGEPLLRADIGDIFDAVRAAGLPICLLTNGLALARHAALVANACHRVVVSLDGYDQSTYAQIRGVDGFGAVARGVAALKAHTPDLAVTARVTVSGHNAGHLLDIAQAAQGMGMDGVSYLAADIDSQDAFGRTNAATGRATPPLNTPALRQELSALVKALPDGFVQDSPAALDRIWQKLAADQGLQEHRPPRCDAPWTSTVVGADLSLRPCFFLPARGDVRRGLASGLAQLAPILTTLQVEAHPTCARCVCWARLT